MLVAVCNLISLKVLRSASIFIHSHRVDTGTAVPISYTAEIHGQVPT